VNRNQQNNPDYYYDENGNLVFTEQYHINKGYCCGHGCRHCPYLFDAVPEPRRSILQAEALQKNSA
jgi:hypothetical protein